MNATLEAPTPQPKAVPPSHEWPAGFVGGIMQYPAGREDYLTFAAEIGCAGPVKQVTEFMKSLDAAAARMKAQTSAAINTACDAVSGVELNRLTAQVSRYEADAERLEKAKNDAEAAVDRALVRGEALDAANAEAVKAREAWKQAVRGVELTKKALAGESARVRTARSAAEREARKSLRAELEKEVRGLALELGNYVARQLPAIHALNAALAQLS
jgi:hypothetical protein